MVRKKLRPPPDDALVKTVTVRRTRLDWYMDQRKMSGRKLSECSGVRENAISRYRSGAQPLTDQMAYKTIMALADALNVKPEDLFEPEGDDHG